MGGPTSAPEPDVSIVRGTQRDYLARLPTGADCALAVEVSVSTIVDDRKKLPIYANGGIPEVWILDAVERRLDAFDPAIGDAPILQRIGPVVGTEPRSVVASGPTASKRAVGLGWSGFGHGSSRGRSGQPRCQQGRVLQEGTAREGGSHGWNPRKWIEE